MDELLNKLNNVPDSYAGFVMGVLTYAKKKTERLNKVLEYMNNHPDAKSDDILEFINIKAENPLLLSGGMNAAS